jgi:16S rRNA (cytidine1402-2'-O)-methyltransferase
VLSIVGTPIGNLEDITYRAVRTLREAELVAAEDTRAARRLLSHFEIPAPRIVSLFEGNEAARTAELLGELAEGRRVALISEAGMPLISDPGERLIAEAAAAGVPIEVVPGPVAAVAALAASGLPAGHFLFMGFPPRDAGKRRQLLGGRRQETATMVLYEAPDRVGATLADLADALGHERKAALARELTKVHEEVVRGSLGELASRFSSQAPRGECTLVVAGAVEGEAAAEVDVEAELAALLGAGLGPKDAAARMVVRTGLPRRQLYQLALSLKRGR